MLNIWALEKDESIKLMLLLLAETLGADSFALAENQELDGRAIRLAKIDDPSIRAYIYTYGQEQEHYGVHLELAVHEEVDISNDVAVYENVSLDRLAGMLCVHFDVVPSAARQRRADV